jgi:hypothetical protein
MLFNKNSYIVDKQTIIYHAQGCFKEINRWFQIQSPYVTDISEQEAITDFNIHIHKLKELYVNQYIINQKQKELQWLSVFF